MARSKDSFESKILTHFRTAELPAAQMLFGLVAGEMRQRTPKVATKKSPKVKKVAATLDSHILDGE